MYLLLKIDNVSSPFTYDKMLAGNAVIIRYVQLVTLTTLIVYTKLLRNWVIVAKNYNYIALKFKKLTSCNNILGHGVATGGRALQVRTSLW